jgi:hypothetical protein
MGNLGNKLADFEKSIGGKRRFWSPVELVRIDAGPQADMKINT